MSTRNIMRRRGTAVFFILFLVVVIALPMSLSCGPIELGANPGFTIDVEECQPFSIQFTSSNTTCPSPVIFYWIVGDLPPYANFDNVTGTLAGCPQVGDTSASFIVGVSEFSPPACGPYFDLDSVDINVLPTSSTCDMIIDPVFYPVAWEEYPFAMDLNVTGGVGPFNWSATGLPAGLTMTDPENGIIEGIPEPGTCGIYTVTVTLSDTGTCCCPDVNRDFVLIVDCWANYPPSYYGPAGCDFSVQIGTGLAQGYTNVIIDGMSEAALAGGQSQTFTSSPCESHLVMVDQTIQGSTPGTRYSVIGSNTKSITDIDNSAFFDYAPDLYISTTSNPSGVAQPTGSGYYIMGSYFSGSTPGTVESTTQADTKYVFREWQLPDGSKSSGVNLAFPVNQAGTVIAEYDIYYLLTLKSDYPSINESSWEKANSTATWNLSLHAVSVESGFWRFLGVSQTPVNSSGQQFMNGPATVQILWRPNYLPAIIGIFIVLLVIAAVVYLIYRFGRKPAAKPAAKSSTKKSPATTRKTK